MSLDPGVVLAPEAPERSVVVHYTIDSGVADSGTTAVKQPSASVRFAQVLQLREDGAPLNNQFGMPAYRYALGGLIWAYDVPLARLVQAQIDAQIDVVTRVATLLGQGNTPQQVINITATEGYPELAMRRQIDVIETERRAGTLQVENLRPVQGTAAPGGA